MNDDDSHPAVSVAARSTADAREDPSILEDIDPSGKSDAVFGRCEPGAD